MALQDAIVSWATRALPGITVVWADQPGTKPLKPFVEINMFGPTKRTGINWLEQNAQATGATLTFTVNVQAFTNASVKAVAGVPANPPVPAVPAVVEVLDAMQLVMDLMMALDDPYLSEDLAGAGIGVGPISGPQDLSQLLDTKYERRISFDWEANVMGVWPTSKTYTIESVPAPTGTFT